MKDKLETNTTNIKNRYMKTTTYNTHTRYTIKTLKL